MPLNPLTALRRQPAPNAWELRELFIQITLLPFALLPRFAGMAACRLWARTLMRPGSLYHEEMSNAIPAPIAARLGPGKLRALRESETFLLYDRVLALRNILFPRWRRPVRVEGLDHLRAALDAGKGAILWVQPCIGSTLDVKRGMHRAGYPLIHLGRPAHGFSPHPFGMAVMNPVFKRAEDRFLAERVIIHEDSVIAPLRQLRRRLGANRAISISLTTDASELATVPFLGRTLLLPTGPIHLARSSGAALLPVFTIGSDAEAGVLIGPPLPTAAGDALATDVLSDWLECHVLAHPLDWIGWRLRLLVSTPSPGSPQRSGTT